jgi:hypothetical protein
MKNKIRRFMVCGASAAFAVVSPVALAALLEIGNIAVPTNATELIYSAVANALVLKNTASAIVVIDLGTLDATTRFANTRFTDMSMSPSGHYVFGADYGGENIGYGTPAAQSYVHRVDLVSKTWEERTAYIAGNVQAVSDTQVILKSIDQWVTFTNNTWGSGGALIPLNTPSGPYWGPAYYAGVYFGDFRFDWRTGRLLHGNSNLSSQEIQSWKIQNNEFVKQEGSGTYGSAQGHGGSVVLATDGSAFYYGDLQVDPLDVTHNTRIFPERIFAASGPFAFGNGNFYSAHSGKLLGELPFKTTVYALNPGAVDFWAFDPLTTTAHHFVPVFYADLVGLALSAGALSPPFASDTLAYSANVYSLDNKLVVTPTALDSAASIKVAGVDVVSGSASAPITLSPGDNTITTVVTAQDGVTTRTYAVNVHYLAVSCTYSLSPMDLSNRPASEGPVSITVSTSAGCPVTATSFQPWVSVSDVVSAGDTTNVSLQIANNGGAARSTAITIADRLFLVTQLGP